MHRVVVTGMGVISPVGNSTESFFQNLVNGVSGIGPITRFDTTDYKVKLAGEVKDFDPEAFGIDKGLARRCDTFTLYALAAAEQAMRQSGLSGAVAPERFGVYVGSGIGGMQTFVNETEKLLTRGPSRVSPFFVPMMISNIAAGNIAIRYGAQGPCLPVVTACATSSHTIGEAFHAIQHGYADAILAGGAEATILPLAVAGFTNLKALSEETDPEKASLPFDARRKGFVLGEGAGILALEEYEHAKARGAQVIGLTDGPMSPVYATSTVCLTARTDMASFVDSMAAPLSVINALIVALGLRRKDELSEHFRLMEGIWDEYRVYVGKDRV